MTELALRSPDEASTYIAKMLCASEVAHLEIREDKCFKDDVWLNVGQITVYPGRAEHEDVESAVIHAARLGSFSWKIPAYDDISRSTEAAFVRNARPPKPSQDDKTRRALEAIVHCAVRCGFLNPTFDAGSAAEMPFVRPTTVVVDTSAVLQGGLDFVARFLYPTARIKVPAIVHMEILNMADRYFVQRRCRPEVFQPEGALLDHVTSQGAQRVLLRLELHTEVEIERPRLGADPLRGIVHPGSDSEDKALGLSQIQRSFADRLILETAIQHRDRLSPDHPIVVLTADQGLARMSLGEGVRTLFFSSPPIKTVFGRLLTGMCFRPFVDGMTEAPYYHVPLTMLVWELACTFGSARLATVDGRHAMTVSAIGNNLSWHPFHSRDDLLWTNAQITESDALQAEPMEFSHSPSADADLQLNDNPKTQAAQPSLGPNRDDHTSQSAGTVLTGAYRFSLPSMIQLILAFEKRQRVLDSDGMRLVGLSTPKRYADLRNFLLAGRFASRDESGLAKLGDMDLLVNAIKTLDYRALRELVLRVPSFQAFVAGLKIQSAINHSDVRSIGQSALTTYIALAEICCVALDVPNEGIYLTTESPPPSEFARLAIAAYRKLRNGETFVLTGKWLEELVRTCGIHPINARERLNESRAAGLLERYTEGSTPETQYERHNMAALQMRNGIPTVVNQSLYHGDFLIPGKASVSIRLEELQR